MPVEPPSVEADALLASYVVGVGDGYHAVTRTAAQRATGGGDRHIRAMAACHAYLVQVIHRGGAFRDFQRGAAPLDHGSVCPDCAWVVALNQDGIAAELAALTPTGRQHDALARLLPDPLITVHLCEAILRAQRSAHLDQDDPLTLQLLAHASRHAPEIAIPEDCGEGSCDHRPENANQSWECWYPDAAVVCPTCSVRAGSWAGEWEGQYAAECTVASPCSVLVALTTRYLPTPVEPDRLRSEG